MWFNRNKKLAEKREAIDREYIRLRAMLDITYPNRSLTTSFGKRPDVLIVCKDDRIYFNDVELTTQRQVRRAEDYVAEYGGMTTKLNADHLPVE